MRAIAAVGLAILAAVPAAAQTLDLSLEALVRNLDLQLAIATVERYQRPLIFIALFLFIGLVFTRLARRVVDPRSRQEAEQYEADAAVTRRVRIAYLIVWSCALLVACEAVELHWFAAVVAPILGALAGMFWAVVIAVAALAVASSFSPATREFVLSLQGWYELNWGKGRPEPGREFDLGDGKVGRFVEVSGLQTTFELPDGSRELRPNAFLMRAYYHWGEPTKQ